ncbi:MAG: TRAP transporter small permease subunit [Syntrophobacterales bacterium]|nr:TRAP transporter small permease subunit [Syntrophobacterales bacterium]
MAIRKINRMFMAADNFIDKGTTWLIVTGGVMVTLTVVLQVVLRYIFKAPLFGLEELSRLIAVWVYFLGAILGTKGDVHVQGDMAGLLFHSDRSRAVIKSITWGLSLLVCLLFLYHSAKYCLWIYGSGEKTPGLWWPRIYSVGSMLFGAFFMTIYSFANVIKHSGTAIHGFEATPGGVL